MMKRRGQIMIEALIAIAVATIGVLALVQMATKSVANSGTAKRQAAATGYAIQANEWVKGQIQLLGWTSFEAAYGGGSGVKYCYNDYVMTTSGPCAVSGGAEFSREVTLIYADAASAAPPPATVRQVTINTEVHWSEGGRDVSAKESVIITRR